VHNEYAPGLGRIGAAVALTSDASDKDALSRLGQQLCMHIVAAHPLAISREGIPASRIEREREILLAQAEGSGKPAEVVEKMVAGRLNKYFQEVALLEQPFVVDAKGAPVRSALEAASKELGAPVECTAFVRYAIGEAAV
jgi:elongation factor Ts